jgi:uncharacterized protein (TIGR02001 family)
VTHCIKKQQGRPGCALFLLKTRSACPLIFRQSVESTVFVEHGTPCASHKAAAHDAAPTTIENGASHMTEHTGKLSLSLLLLAAAFHPETSSEARAELSANIGVVSNYYFRGFSESDDGAAVQGGLDWESPTGFYVGTWASNVDFGDDTSYELDLYLGFANELDNGLGYDIGYLYYAYPDAPGSADFGEIYGELSYSLFSVGAAYVVNDSDDSALESGDVYYYAGVDFPLANEFSLGFLVGRTAFDDSDRENYTHFTASLGKETDSIGAFSFNLEYEDSFDKDLKAWLGWTLGF